MRPAGVAVLLSGCLALALGLRALGFEFVFVDADTVVLPAGDAQYHFRRAFYGWANFPEVIFFDPYINFPGGAAVSWPPLFDFVLASLGHLLVRDTRGFEVMAAWAPPVFGALALLPVYAVGHRLGGAWQGLGAAALLALLPMSVNYSRVGQLDHHCAVALIGGCLLLVVVRLADGARASLALALALTAGRCAMLLTWHGSLLYLVLVEVTLWVAAAFSGRRDLYKLQAGSAVATVAFVGPLVWAFPEPLGGPWSAIGLSWLHVVAMGAVAIVSGGSWWLEGRSAKRSPGSRLAWTAAIGAGVVAVLLLLPATREGLEPALRFLTMEDGVGHRTGEQLPLFSGFGRATGRPVWSVWGALGYALPLLPFAVVWATPREHRGAGLVVAAWCAWWATLAIVQRRYGNDLGPAAAVGFALVFAAVGHRLLRDERFARAAMVVTGLLALSPPITTVWAPKLASGFAVLAEGSAGGDRALRSPAGSLTRFLEQVRLVTPETSGYFDLATPPEYGVVAHANFGHAIQNIARRPTPTDPFWAFIGQENWNDAFGLLAAPSERVGFALARRLEARYVMTFSSADPASLEGWLHFADGIAVDRWPAASHFRLVTEGPKGGAHFGQSFQVEGRGRVTGVGTLPYKLFEVVEGAVLRTRTEPLVEVVATLRLVTPTGRERRYETRALADAEGIARLRVPYPTRAQHGHDVARALAPYLVQVGERRIAVGVSEAQVRNGETIEVSLPPPSER